MENVVAQLAKLCATHGATLEKKSEFHYHIHGALLVNYYPSKRTAYVRGTTAGVVASPKQAVQLAFKLPEANGNTVDRRKNQQQRRELKRKLYRKNKRCHWCGIDMLHSGELDSSVTIDHIIPLSRGGLDCRNNVVLACRKCNQARGNDMPELNLSPKGKTDV